MLSSRPWDDLPRLRASGQAYDVKGVWLEVLHVPSDETVRSVVLHPYRQVTDPCTEFSSGDVDGVLDGDIDGFVRAWRERGD